LQNFKKKWSGDAATNEATKKRGYRVSVVPATSAIQSIGCILPAVPTSSFVPSYKTLAAKVEGVEEHSLSKILLTATLASGLRVEVAAAAVLFVVFRGRSIELL
jgi:hypothetical protein